MATAVRPAAAAVEESIAQEQQQETIKPPRKLGLFRRLRKKNKQKTAEVDILKDDREDDATLDELKDVQEIEESIVKPPAARDAAYGGPPRYDWIDIETAAAVKVQSIARRNITMEHLAADGITTAAIRNRNRRRQAPRGASGSADVPNLFACCGIGLAFGDATEEDYEATRAYQREEYYQRKQEKERREAELRETFQKAAAKKKAARTTNDVQEAYEVVE